MGVTQDYRGEGFGGCRLRSPQDVGTGASAGGRIYRPLCLEPTIP